MPERGAELPVVVETLVMRVERRGSVILPTHVANRKGRAA